MLRTLLRNRTAERLARRWTNHDIPLVSDPPVPPREESCCGQGCANCVWIEYGTQLLAFYKTKSRDEALKELEDKIQDPSIKAFVISELKLNS